jgi:hypothetical protein
MVECCAYCVVCCVAGFKLLDRIASSRLFGRILANCIFPGIILFETMYYFTRVLPAISRGFGSVYAAGITTFGLFVLSNLSISLVLAQFMGQFNFVETSKIQVVDNECSKCGAERPEHLRIHHCSTCNRCVYRHDHHCRKFYEFNCLDF